MTQAEGNKLIAEFDGYVYFPNDTLNSIKGVYRKEDRMPMLANHFKYHSSWDWLMPVVEKIEDLGNYGVEIHLKSCNIFEASIDQSDLCIEGHFETKKESIWQAVVQFIQWYNNQKPKP
jgi:hypothetical protein